MIRKDLEDIYEKTFLNNILVVNNIIKNKYSLIVENENPL